MSDPIGMFTGCDLHIPHKEWSGDEAERQNYLEIERWSKRLHDCYEPAGPDTGGTLGHVSRVCIIGDITAMVDTTSTINFTANNQPPPAALGTNLVTTTTGCRVLTAGHLGWAGYVQFNAPTAPAGAVAYVEIDPGTASSYLIEEVRQPISLVGNNIYSIGGSGYCATNDFVQFFIGKSASGQTMNMHFQLTLNLFPWPA